MEQGMIVAELIEKLRACDPQAKAVLAMEVDGSGCGCATADLREVEPFTTNEGERLVWLSDGES